jgi:undecaprenyl diphosphate synthase
MNEEKIQSLKVPAHIAIIMDGNGRWAKKRGMPRTFGQSQGAKVVEQILEDADHIGVKYLTVYAFSTENWSRPQTEVKALMNLLRRYMKTSLAKCAKNNVRVRVIGDKSMLDQDLQDSIADLERDTAANTGIGFQIAINYGGRDDIVRAVRRAAEKGLLNDPGRIDESLLNDCLDTAGIPDPDLLIRTCGEQRISNFLLWQLAYTELYFTPVAWPDFDRGELEQAIRAYASRTRKFGGLKDTEPPAESEARP